MPASCYHDVRLSVLFVGVSLSVTLATSVFVAIFLGLQRYRVPMVTTIVSRRRLRRGGLCDRCRS